MIKSLTFKAGRSPGQAGETIHPTPLTVFIGPNNAGKSAMLQEIVQRCVTGTLHGSKLIESIELESLEEGTFGRMLDTITYPYLPGEPRYPDQLKVGDSRSTMQVHLPSLKMSYQDPNGTYATVFASGMMSYFTLKLDGATRLMIFDNQNSGDLQFPRPVNLLQTVMRDSTIRSELRRISYDAFGSYFVLDPTGMSILRARLSDREPDEGEEINIDSRAVEFHGKAMATDVASDGVKAFLGIISEVLAGYHRVITIDEPEAFLHPGLASQLGKEVAKAASVSNKKIFVSTHSAPFLMGCIQAGVPINIVRLTYQRGVATSRVLTNDEIGSLMRHPLLRSSNLLNGLFYQAVLVGESDTDRAFYQEVNERLLSFTNDGIRNCLFINAQNKDTIRTILAPLRKLGIPAAGVVDVDFIKEANWRDLYPDIAIPHARTPSLNALRASVKAAMEATGRNMKTDGGIEILGKEDRAAAVSLINQLADYGCFIVPTGEVESWLKRLSVPGHGSKWLIGMLEAMGSDPTSGGYVMPEKDDVWMFMSKISEWCANPSREGIPD